MADRKVFAGVLQLQPTKIVSYRKLIFGSYSRSANVFDLQSVKNKTNGKLSRNSIKRLKYSIQLLLCIAKEKDIYWEDGGYWFSYKIGFLTLTLPSEQGQFTDSELKRKILMPFLQDLKRKYKLNNYIWKAEAQENGNIHFHLTIDVFIHHNEIRYLWNLHLAKFGFIEKYRKQQEAWHSNGFRPRMSLIENWPIKKQYEAYKKGVKENWSNPNTIDLHSVKNIKNLAGYLIKYMCKSEQGKRAIEGKLFGVSKSLSYKVKCEVLDVELSVEESEALDRVLLNTETKYDHVTIYEFNVADNYKELPEMLQVKWLGYLKELSEV